jgi:Domain of unknown function (DUF4262)
MAGRTTERIKQLRQRHLEPDELKLVDDVEKYGCHIIQVREGNGVPGWSYTVGLHDVLGAPELIVIGLRNGVAQNLLNDCNHRLDAGMSITDGCREQELLANVECEFRRVETRWLRQTMGYAVWFYGGDEFPVSQCIYPDLANRFPWEEGFDMGWRSRQPLLFSHTLDSSVEKDFWSANDPSSSLHDWKFEDPPHTGVFTTKRVMSGEDVITHVFHDADDGAWQFHGPGESKREDVALVCFHHIIDKDGTIVELADLPLGWCAWRETAEAPWRRDLTAAHPEWVSPD